MYCVNMLALLTHAPGSLIRASSTARTAHTDTHTPAISLMCREARESRGNMSICCCDWQHFSQIYPAQPVGSQEESGEKKVVREDIHLHTLHRYTHTLTLAPEGKQLYSERMQVDKLTLSTQLWSFREDITLTKILT